MFNFFKKKKSEDCGRFNKDNIELTEPEEISPQIAKIIEFINHGKFEYENNSWDYKEFSYFIHSERFFLQFLYEKKWEIIILNSLENAALMKSHDVCEKKRKEKEEQKRKRAIDEALFGPIKVGKIEDITGTEPEIKSDKIWIDAKGGVIKQYTYDLSQKLTIMFDSGQEYFYFNVPMELFLSFVQAESHIDFFNSNIRNKFTYEKL